MKSVRSFRLIQVLLFLLLNYHLILNFLIFHFIAIYHLVAYSLSSLTSAGSLFLLYTLSSVYNPNLQNPTLPPSSSFPSPAPFYFFSNNPPASLVHLFYLYFAFFTKFPLYQFLPPLSLFFSLFKFSSTIVVRHTTDSISFLFSRKSMRENANLTIILLSDEDPHFILG